MSIFLAILIFSGFIFLLISIKNDKKDASIKLNSPPILSRIETQELYTSVDYYNRGVAKHNLGDKQGAIDNYNSALKINPNYADAYTNRGLAKSNLGNQQAAIDDFDIAIKFKPNNLQAYINRGWSNFLSNHNQGAIADWGKSISLEPTAGAYCNLGLYKVILGNNAEGLVDLEQAIKLDPKLADNFVVRGFIRGAAGDKEGMLSDYKQALKFNPQIIDEWKRDAKQLQKYNNIAAYQKYQQILSGLTFQQ